LLLGYLSLAFIHTPQGFFSSWCVIVAVNGVDLTLSSRPSLEYHPDGSLLIYGNIHYQSL
jgi:hypothetical protein